MFLRAYNAGITAKSLLTAFAASLAMSERLKNKPLYKVFMGLSTDILLWVLYFVALYFSIFILTIFVFESEKTHKKPHTCPLVSIIIPAWNEEKSIRETVESTLHLNYPQDKLQIIAVNHGSDDKTGKILDSIKGIEVLHITRKKGDNKAVAFNKGLARAEGKFVACLDADSVVSAEALNDMLPYFAESEKVAVVTPSMLIKSPKNLLQWLQKYEYIVSLFVKRLSSHINCIYVAPGPFSLYRTSILKELGGFDEKAIAEDMEIVYRLQKNQYIAKQCLKGGYSYVAAPNTIKELYKQRQRWYGGSLSNIYQYRKLAFNRRYGDFGFFQMPKNLMGVVTVFTTLALFAYFALWPLARKAYYFFVIRFEIMPYLLNPNINLNIFTLKNVQGAFVVLILMIISLIFFICACRMANEKMQKATIPVLLVFFTVYPLMLCVMYLMVAFKKMLRQDFVWDKMAR